MASRMDRYYEKPRVPRARSLRNEELYKRIKNMETYSNIEAIETITRTNEIDISKVKEMIKNRENYKKQKQYLDAFNMDESKPKEVEVKKYFEEEKNYDIMDVLNKAKDNHEEENENRSLKKLNYGIINELNLRNKNYDDVEEELNDLVNTITNKDDDKNNNDNNDFGGLLDDLTSDTMVGESSSIRSIMNDEIKSKDIESTNEMDKSFFTSAMSFKDKDFDDLTKIIKKDKKNKWLIIVIISIILLIVAGVILFLIFTRR